MRVTEIVTETDSDMTLPSGANLVCQGNRINDVGVSIS